MGTEFLTGTKTLSDQLATVWALAAVRWASWEAPLVVQFFQGRQEPFLTRATDPINMGLWYSVMLPYTAGAITWRGMVTNAGA